MTILIRGTEFRGAICALEGTGDDSGRPIQIAGRCFVVDECEAERLATEGVPFFYLGDCRMPDGSYRLVTVPVN